MEFLEKAIQKLNQLYDEKKIDLDNDDNHIDISCFNNKFNISVFYKTEWVEDYEEINFAGNSIEEAGKRFYEWLLDFDEIIARDLKACEDEKNWREANVDWFQQVYCK